MSTKIMYGVMCVDDSGDPPILAFQPSSGEPEPLMVDTVAEAMEYKAGLEVVFKKAKHNPKYYLATITWEQPE